MNSRAATRCRSLEILLFLSLSADVVVRPFATQPTSNAVQGVWMAAYVSLVVLLLVAAASWATLPEGGATVYSKPMLTVWLVVFSYSAGAVLLQTEEFYRYISDIPLPAVVTAGVLLAVAGYAVSCGFETLSRTAQVYGSKQDRHSSFV